MLPVIDFNLRKQKNKNNYKFSYQVSNKNELFNDPFYINLGKSFSSFESWKLSKFRCNHLIRNKTINYNFYCDNKNLSLNQYHFFKKRLLQDIFQAGFIYSFKSTKQELKITITDRKKS